MNQRLSKALKVAADTFSLFIIEYALLYTALAYGKANFLWLFCLWAGLWLGNVYQRRTEETTGKSWPGGLLLALCLLLLVLVACRAGLAS